MWLWASSWTSPCFSPLLQMYEIEQYLGCAKKHSPYGTSVAARWGHTVPTISIRRLTTQRLDELKPRLPVFMKPSPNAHPAPLLPGTVKPQPLLLLMRQGPRLFISLSLAPHSVPTPEQSLVLMGSQTPSRQTPHSVRVRRLSPGLPRGAWRRPSTSSRQGGENSGFSRLRAMRLP